MKKLLLPSVVMVLALMGGVVLADFDGQPASPLPFAQHSDWNRYAVTQIQSNENAQASHAHLPWNADHGANCAAPPASHTVTLWKDAKFVCNDHLMVSMHLASYGVTTVIKNELLDWSGGPATFDFRMDTRKHNARDWFTLELTPFLDMAVFSDSRGCSQPNGRLARSGVHFDEEGASLGVVLGRLVGSCDATTLDEGANFYDGIGLPIDGPAPNQSSVRQPFRLTVSSASVKLERLADASVPGSSYRMIAQANVALPFTSGVVVWAEHNYDSHAGLDFRCRFFEPSRCGGVVNDTPSWHLDEFKLTCNPQPCKSFTLVKTALEYAGPGITQVHMNAPAPAGTYLSFANLQPGGQLPRISFDGVNWITAQSNLAGGPALMNAFLVPVPAGVQDFRIDNGGGGYARDFTYWSLNGGPPPSTPTPSPTTQPASPTAIAPTSTIPPSTSTLMPSTPTVVATATPMATTVITSTPTPVAPTPTPTATPDNRCSIDTPTGPLNGTLVAVQGGRVCVIP